MSGRILIIDDDPDFTEALSTLLDAKGYEVMSAQDGKDGFAKAKSNVPDLILLDVMMTTKTEGFDVAHMLKDDDTTRDVPVIIISGIHKDMSLPFTFEPDRDWLPVKAVLEKPVKPEILIRAVEQNINK